MRYLNVRTFFKRLLAPDRPLHAVDRRMAKEWIKKRLAALYPELRGDPAALEQAYRELDLEPTGTVRRADGEVKSFQMNLPPEVGDGFEQR
jgi:hypothetical protein